MVGTKGASLWLWATGLLGRVLVVLDPKQKQALSVKGMEGLVEFSQLGAGAGAFSGAIALETYSWLVGGKS